MFPVYRINSVPSSEHGYHSPLGGESEKPSRMAKADAVGGSHKASQRRDLVRRSGNRRRVSVAVGESQRSSRRRRPMRWGANAAPPNGSAEWRRLMRWGGSHKASHRRDLVRRSGNRRRASVAVGESQKPSRMAKADAVGGFAQGEPQARSCAPLRRSHRVSCQAKACAP